MFPVLFHVGSFPVATYGVMLGVGFFVGLLLGTWQAKRDGLPGELAWDLGILTMFTAILGARLEYVRTHPAGFLAHPATIFAVREGGLVFYGGFVLTLLGYVVYARWRRVSVLALFDLMAPSVGFGHAIGRIGCLAAGCCYGMPTTSAWSTTFPEGSLAPAGVPLVPTQVHEVLFNLLMGLGLAWMPRRFVGQRFAVLLLAYPIFRSLNELLRGDEIRGRVFGTAMTNAQATSIVLALVAAGVWMYGSRRTRLNNTASS